MTTVLLGLLLAVQPSASEKEEISARLSQLTAQIQRLHAPEDLIADVEVYRKAVEWILRYPEEFYSAAYVEHTLEVLERGVHRAQELAQGEPSWIGQKGRLVRAYRSRVDGSVQPYGLVIPDSYDGSRSVRLDLVLHGRGSTLNEVSFIAAHDSRDPVPPDQDYIQLDVFGRTNNAYRWSGETDVFEALESVRKRYRIDPGRIVLRGFSMGGAGAWHLGLHYPDRWAGMEAGAGFTETRRYAKQSDLPEYQVAALHIYDAVDYALNAFNLPVVGYGGEDDPQLQASVNIREALTREGFHFQQNGLNRVATDLRALFLVGPHTRHRFHPESKKTSNVFLDRAAATGRRDPDQIRFVTWTERYNRCFWVTVEQLEKEYQRAEVDATRSAGGIEVRTRNVARVRVDSGGRRISLDGQRFPSGTEFRNEHGRWAVSRAKKAGLRKKNGLQGPIDDAFAGPFLCVRPTGAAQYPKVNAYGLDALNTFQREFAKYFRGDIPIKDDRAVTKDDISQRNLILFGDPGSNRLIARIAGKLPIHWSNGKLRWEGRAYSPATHVPVLVYPNPLNPERYVVINSGHTFHESDLKGTNALLFPRLGDYAIISIDSGRPVVAGLFDESWK